MKPIRSFLRLIQLANTSKERKKLNQSMASTFIKEVLFLVTKLELLILKELMFKLAAEHIAIILQRLDGLKSSNLPVSVMVSCVCTSLPTRRFLNP